MVLALWMRVKAIEEIVENDIRYSINIRGVFNSQPQHPSFSPSRLQQST
jgi:hypothetical protein